LKTSADTIAAMPLMGNEVGIVAVRELIAMVLVEYFGLLRHQTSPAARSWPRA
jgi:Ni/Fe-hydrogenase subunit HybB-like protein